MANNNEPLLHFGDDNEVNNNSNNAPTASEGQIKFNDFADEAEAKPAEKPAEAAPAPEPTQPTPQPAPQPTPQPRQATQPKPKPSATDAQPKPQAPHPAFGKKNLQINLIVVNNSGVVLPRYTVNKQDVESGRALTFQEERETYDLIISANGYKDKRIQVTQQDLIKGEKRVSLLAQSQSFIVAINTPDGIKRGSIEIDQNNAIYQYIKDASHTDTPLNELVIGDVGHNNGKTTGKVSVWPYVIALCVGILLGVGVSSMFSCNDEEKTEEPTEIVDSPESQGEDLSDEIAAQPTLDTEAPVVDNIEEVKTDENEAEEKKQEEKKEEEKKEEMKEEPVSKEAIAEADVAYLKSKDVWNRSQTTSEEAKRLLAAFTSGNIETIISNNAYNALPKNKRNGYYNKLVDDLKRIKGQSNYNEAKIALRDLCKDGNINLVKVQDKMHRMLL